MSNSANVNNPVAWKSQRQKPPVSLSEEPSCQNVFFCFFVFFRKIVPNNPSERYRLRVIRRDAKKQAADLKMTFLSNQLAPWNVPELWNAPEGSSADWAIPSDRAKNRSNVLCSKRSQRDFLTWIRSSKFTRARLNRLTYKTPPGQRVQL